MGIGMLVVMGGFFAQSNFLLSGLAQGFVALWVFGLLFAIGYHLYNAATGDGHGQIIENLSDSKDDAQRVLENEFDARRQTMLNSFPKAHATPHPSSEKSDAEERLEQLSNLKAKGLISEEEYTSKRREIIDQL